MNEQTQKTEFTYGAAENGQKPGIVYNVKVNGTNRVSYGYDALCRVQQKTLNLGNATHTTSYEYLAGATPDVTTALVKRVTAGSAYTDYTYDAIGNVLTISENGTLKVTYHYDALNRLVREDNVWENKTICYTYDIGGNMLSWKEYAYTTGTIAADAVPTLTNTYVYGNTTWKDQLTSFNGMPITYDAMGNPLTYKYWTLGWEKGRQLVSADDGFEPILFAYNNEGQRIRKSYLGEVTRYYWNGKHLAAMQTGDTLVQFAYDETGKPISMSTGSAIYYYLHNLQGDVVGLLDASGNQMVSYNYNSWGRMTGMTDTTGNQIGLLNPFRYRGYIQDDETGMYYVGSRYYDPEVGRFVNADTTSVLEMTPNDVIDKNLYAYCDSNPIVRVDASGQIWTAIAISVGINFACLAIESLLTGDKPTKEDILWCLVGGVFGGVVSFWNVNLFAKAVVNGLYSGVESLVRGGDLDDYAVAIGAGALSAAVDLDNTDLSSVEKFAVEFTAGAGANATATGYSRGASTNNNAPGTVNRPSGNSTSAAGTAKKSNTSNKGTHMPEYGAFIPEYGINGRKNKTGTGLKLAQGIWILGMNW